jgi:HEAT repeat protein
VSALASTDAKELASVILALGEVLYRPEDVVPKLVPFLANSNDLVRMEASYSLGTYGADPARTMKPLIERLSDPNAVVKANGARALGRMGRDALPAVEPLLKALRVASPRAPVAARALEALSSIAPEVLRSVPAEMDEWVAAKIPEDSYFGVMKATARERLGVQAPTLTADCLSLAQSSTAYIRWEALERLGECGSSGQEVRAVLARGLSDPNGLVRRTAQQALERWSHRQAAAAEQRSLSPFGQAEE